VFRWFLPKEYGGLGWSQSQIVGGYVQLASACLATTFVLTQRSAACRRIAMSESLELRSRLLPDLANGRAFATVGISHLSTSRRHLGTPAVRAERMGTGYRLHGTTWWVTGAAHADHIVVGAEIDGEEILVVVPVESVRVGESAQLVALTSSCTAAVHLDGVEVPARDIVAGPCLDVMGTSRSGGTGGLQTSALALGLARAAADSVGEQVPTRAGLREEHLSMTGRLDVLEGDLIDFAEGEDRYTKRALRRRANSLVLEATQTALRVAKGAGYLAGREPGRWCREALFFLVWSLEDRH
jgi:alkylation response protein AidB-like acyl-CoA dehydrogenase